MSPLTPQKPADTRPPNKPSTPPPPKQPTQPSKPWTPPKDAVADILDDIAVMLEGAQGWATLLPEQDLDPALRMALLERIRLARRAVADLQSPGRRDPSSAAVGADAIATPGGPGRTARLTPGECLTPGYGAAGLTAVAGSAGAVLGRSAGASSSRPREEARAGGPLLVPGAGFKTPAQPTVPSFDNGPHPWPGRPFPVHHVSADVWQPSTPGQPPTPPPPDPHPQDRVSQALARRAD